MCISFPSCQQMLNLVPTSRRYWQALYNVHQQKYVSSGWLIATFVFGFTFILLSRESDIERILTLQVFQFLLLPKLICFGFETQEKIIVVKCLQGRNNMTKTRSWACCIELHLPEIRLKWVSTFFEDTFKRVIGRYGLVLKYKTCIIFDIKLVLQDKTWLDARTK